MNWSTLIAKLRRAPADEKPDSARLHAYSLWKRLLGLTWKVMAGLMIVIMALLVWQSRVALLAVLRTARYEYFAWAFVIYTISIGPTALGWHLVMRHLGGPDDFILNLKIYVYTLAGRRLPGTLWYIAGRAVLYKRLGVSRRASSLASGIEVILSIVSGSIIGAPALFSQIGVSPASIMTFALIELIGLSLLYPSVLHWLLARFGYQVEPGRLTVPRILAWLGAYVGTWISGGLVAFTVVSALHPLDLSQIPLIISLWALAGTAAFVTFLLPNNLGAQEITLSVLLSGIVPLPVAIASAVLLRVLTTIFDVMWSSLFLWEKNEALSTQ